MAAPTRLIALALAVLGLGAALGAAGSAAATPGEVTAYPAARNCDAGYLAPAAGAGVVVRGCGGAAAANLLPSGALVPLPATEFPDGPTVIGPAGEAWIGVEEGDFLAREPVMVRVAADGTVQRFPIPVADRRYELVVAGLAVGVEGDLWAAIGEGGSHSEIFSESVGGELMRVTPAGEEAFFPLPAGLEPRGLAVGREGALWFTAVRWFIDGEHTNRPGVGWIGRMTPARGLSLFRTPVRGSVPAAIAAAPDGTLWYVESWSGDLGTFHPDGRPGRRYPVRGYPPQAVVVGPEGDTWTSAESRLTRVTPGGQRTRFPVPGGSLAVGREGDIWVGGRATVARVVPGAPGLQLLGLRRGADGGPALTVELACGGSARGCKGTLELILEIPGHRDNGGHGVTKRPHFRFGRTAYSVAAESRRTVRVAVPAKALAIAARFPGEPRFPGRGLVVRATVVGGPPLSTQSSARTLLLAGRQAGATK